MNFGEKVLRFNRWMILNKPVVPKSVELLVPFATPDVIKIHQSFYSKYYNDTVDRYFLLGINPGRFGAGITGIPFTDPVNLAADAGIANSFNPKAELSSYFMHRMMTSMGGLDVFYHSFYITAVCPIGFVRNGINLNYYDDQKLYKSVEPFLVKAIERQLKFGCKTEQAFVIGEGKNMEVFSKLNDKFGWFGRINGLPHPRFIMQYRRKQMDEYLELYTKQLKPWMA